MFAMVRAALRIDGRSCFVLPAFGDEVYLGQGVPDGDGRNGGSIICSLRISSLSSDRNSATRILVIVLTTYESA